MAVRLMTGEVSSKPNAVEKRLPACDLQHGGTRSGSRPERPWNWQRRDCARWKSAFRSQPNQWNHAAARPQKALASKAHTKNLLMLQDGKDGVWRVAREPVTQLAQAIPPIHQRSRSPTTKSKTVYNETATQSRQNRIMVKIIAGLMGSSVSSGSTKLANPQQLRSFLSMLKNHDVHELDTARLYNGGESEKLVGSVLEAKDEFDIATKAPGFAPDSLTYQKVIDNCNASLAALKQQKIDLYYFHGPDRKTPLEESLRAINELYREGKFERFGISNFHVTEVEEMQSICQKRGYVRPSVYQGGYNAILRAGEPELFPILRKYGMAFYAYSPLAGGFFSRPTMELRTPPTGSRMDQMKVFSSLYVNDLSLNLHDRLSEVCSKEGITLKEAALRWLMHHSILQDQDGVVLGASSSEQMEENLKACNGGILPVAVVECFENAWEKLKEAGYSTFYCIPL